MTDGAHPRAPWSGLLIEAPTHAGGVVVRGRGADARFLLVTARRQHGLWVFPKGHIEPGESAEQAAVREVFEEAGVRADVVAPIGTLEFVNARGVVRAQFYLMTFTSELAAGEGRTREWFSASDADRALRWEDSRLLIARARDWASVAG